MTTYPHRIRLRDPWDVETAGDGTSRARRKFNFPAELGPREDVWLMIADSSGLLAWTVNDARYSSDDFSSGVGLSITKLLRRHNVVDLELAPGGTRGEVYLEVRLLDPPDALLGRRRPD
ncbi:MAG: hypothetical protein JNL96_28565 [Planctomycetaceae bacterium]|nr:hypothetical protein [Planctomycetaceae bacterium]